MRRILVAAIMVSALTACGQQPDQSEMGVGPQSQMVVATEEAAAPADAYSWGGPARGWFMGGPPRAAYGRWFGGGGGRRRHPRRGPRANL